MASAESSSGVKKRHALLLETKECDRRQTVAEEGVGGG